MLTHPDILKMERDGFIGEELTEQQSFIIDTDQKAEWALKKLKKIDNEYARLVEVCTLQIKFYKEKINQYDEKRNDERRNLMAMLANYFESVPSKSTKTQATYKLPSGKLIKKFEKEDFKHDSKKLLEALKDTRFVEIQPSLKWGEYKKTLQIISGNVVDENGEIVEGVTVEITPASFDAEV